MTESAPAAAGLVEGPLFRRTLRFGLPLALGMAAHGLFNCVDLVIVGRLGEGAVAAVTLGGVINMVAMLAYNGVANVLAGQAADLEGRGDRPGLVALERASEKLTWAAALVLGAGFALAARPLIALGGVDDGTAALATEYLIICSLGSGTMFFVLWGAALLRARGESFWPMAVLIGSNVLNLALDLVLVFGLLGFPRLGVAGAAWATVIARALGAVVLVFLLHRRRGTEKGHGPVRPLIREMLVKGLFNSAQTVARVVGLYLVLSTAARAAADNLGPLAARDLLDGVGVAIRLEMVLMFAALGFGAAAATFLAQNLGAERPERARRGLAALVLEAVVFGGLLAALLWFFRAELFALAAPGTAEAAREFGVSYLARLLPAQPLLAVGIVLSQALVGIRSVRTAVIVDGLLYVGFVPIVTSLAADGAETAFAALALAHLAAALVYPVLMRRRLRARDRAASAKS